jgi:hypothetical protein
VSIVSNQIRTRPSLGFRSVITFALLVFLFGWAVTAYAGTRSVALTWDLPVDADTNATVSQYYIFYGTTSGVYTNTIVISSLDYDNYGGGYFINNLPEGPTYYFMVQAQDTDGNHSKNSNEASLALPAPKPVFMHTEVYPEAYTMAITWTNSTVTTWYFESSTDLKNWTIDDQNHTTDPSVPIEEDVYLDYTIPQVFYRVVDY